MASTHTSRVGPSDRTREARLSALLGALLFLVTLPYAAWMGLAIHLLWGWFVVPLGVSPLGIWHAAGLAVLVRLLTIDTRDLKENERPVRERVTRILTTWLTLPASAIAIGAIYHALG